MDRLANVNATIPMMCSRQSRRWVVICRIEAAWPKMVIRGEMVENDGIP